MANEITIEKKVLDDLLSEINGELTAMLKSEKVRLEKAVQESSPSEESEGSSTGIPMESLEDSSSSSSSTPDSSTSSDSSSTSSDSSSDSSSSDSSSSDSSTSSSDSSDSSSTSDSSSDSSGSDSGSSGSSDDSSSSSSDSSGSSADSMDQMAVDGAMNNNEQDQEPSLKDEYLKLSPEDLKAHCQAAKEALMELMGQEDSSGSSSDGSSSSDSGSSMSKAEKKMDKALECSESSMSKAAEKPEASKEESSSSTAEMSKSMHRPEMMSKSEAEEKIAKLEAQLKEKDEAVNKLTAFLLKPLRKAVTTETDVEDADPTLTKEEIKQKLRQKVQMPLSKNDRELINGYHLGTVGVDKIKHLLA